jgi:hypothetical protein
VDEEAVRFLTGDDLAELLERPVRGGMSGDVAVSDPARSLCLLKTLFADEKSPA